MRKNDGKRFWTFAALVNEVDCGAIYLRFEVSKLIERCLVFPPVIRVLPVANEICKVL